jgi:signal transduction histidine kinase
VPASELLVSRVQHAGLDAGDGMSSGSDGEVMRPGADVVRDQLFGRIAIARPAWGLGGRYMAGVVGLASAYYAAAKVGFELEFAGPVAAVVWLPAGVAIAFLSMGGMRFWPGVLLGDLLVNDYSALPLGSALGQTAGNMLEVLVAALLIRRLVARGSPLDSLGGLGRLLAAIAAGTAISATVGPLSLLAGQAITTGALPAVARTWWLGDAAGALVVIPFALAWYQPPPRGFSGHRALEAVAMLAVVAGMSEVAFRTESPLAYLVFPALGWAGLRFGRRGATLAIAVAVGFAVWNTTHYHGPFAFDSTTRSVLTTQLYIAVAALSTLSLAALVSERRRFAERLDASRVRLINASDIERRRLEHNLHDGAQQRLTALAIQLGLAAERARDAREGGAPALEAAGTEVFLAIDELRELARGIHPAVLTDGGLAAAMRAVAARSSVHVALLQLPATRSDVGVEATAYYVFVEALTNAQKHAAASSIRVRALTTTSTLHLDIVDDGIGGATERPDGGLTGLRDRVEALGGTFDVESPSGRGTRIAATVPQRRPRSPSGPNGDLVQ